MNIKAVCVLALLIFLTTFTLFQTGTAESEDVYVPNSLTFNVYSDGFVLVEYEILSDPTYPAINITLFGEVIEDLVVVDE